MNSCLALIIFTTMLYTLAHCISHLDVSLNTDDERMLQSQGFQKLNVDLNKGAGGNYIYIWYKKDASSAPITRVQLTFNTEMGNGLTNAGYTKIPKNLNAGTGGDYIYLWYFRGRTEYDIPIVDIDVTTDAESEGSKFTSGWERLACDLNRKAEGNWIHVWVKRESQTYISDVTVTASYGSDAYYFREGYTRLDEDTNRNAGGAYVFIWYRQTTDSQHALSDLHISTSDYEREALEQQNYQRVNVDLNQGNTGSVVNLWYKKEVSDTPIKAITLLVNSNAAQAYEGAGATVIRKDLNTGNNGWTEYLCFYQ